MPTHLAEALVSGRELFIDLLHHLLRVGQLDLRIFERRQAGVEIALPL